MGTTAATNLEHVELILTLSVGLVGVALWSIRPAERTHARIHLPRRRQR